MNTLDIDKTGGLKFTQDDLLWAFKGFIEAITNGLTLKGQQNYIIAGCTPIVPGSGGPTFQGHTAGLVMLNGEICVIDADPVGIDTMSDPTSGWVFEKASTFDPSGNKGFFSGGPIQMYKITKAVIVNDPTPPTDSFDFNSMPRQETLIAQSITPLAMQFAKTIAFKQGANKSIVGGVLSLDSDGNSVNVAITANDTLTGISVLSTYYPSGTFVFLQFTGSAGSTVTVTPGLGLVTPGSRNYVYNAGDWCIFMVNGGNFRLMEKDGKSPWNQPSAFLNSWINTGPFPFRYRKSSDNRVTLDGTLIKVTYSSGMEVVYNLPAKDRPSQDQNFMFVGMGGQPCTVYISASTGDVTVSIAGITASLGEIWFSGLSYYTD
jgi:hypothetical protein